LHQYAVRQALRQAKEIEPELPAGRPSGTAAPPVDKLRAMKLSKATEIVENGIEDTLSYYVLPPEHWCCLRTNNPLERLMREPRRRIRVVGTFPDDKSALMLVAARLRHVAGTRWITKRYLHCGWAQVLIRAGWTRHPTEPRIGSPPDEKWYRGLQVA
jgi:putative transposase